MLNRYEKLKIFNLAATNAILMKLTTIMYLQKTFHVVKKKKKKKEKNGA